MQRMQTRRLTLVEVRSSGAGSCSREQTVKQQAVLVGLYPAHTLQRDKAVPSPEAGLASRLGYSRRRLGVEADTSEIPSNGIARKDCKQRMQF